MSATGQRHRQSRRVATLFCLGAVLTLAAGCDRGAAEPAATLPTATGTGTALATNTYPGELGGTWTRQDVLDMYADDGGALRLRLPISLHDGYEFIGFTLPDTVETDRGEQVAGRKAWFSIGQEIITVCVENLNLDDGICPDTNIGVSREHGHTRWDVSVEIPVLADTETWGTASYSVNPDDWTWMDS